MYSKNLRIKDNFLNQELLTQYENYFQMFRTEGWKQFIEDMQDIFDTYRIEDFKDEKQLVYAQGERRILNQILHFESSIKTNYDTLVESSDD